MEYEFEIAGRTRKVVAEKKGAIYQVDLGDGKMEVDCRIISPNGYLLIINKKPLKVYLAEADGKYYVFINGEHYCIEDAQAKREDDLSRDSSHVESNGEICAPMPGKILKIIVTEGATVEKNQSLAIVEAMKMEHDIRSPIAGVVRKINFEADDLVDTGQPIIELEPRAE